MKSADVKPETYKKSGAENNGKDPKFNVDNRERISKHENIFPKSYTRNWFQKVFLIKKVENAAPWKYFSMISKVKKMLEHSIKKNSRRIQGKNISRFQK